MMKSFGLAVVAAALLALPSNAAAGELRLSIANGRVTLIAQEVSIKQILDEWSRVGQTRIVGAERLVGPPVTLEMHDIPEAKALETLLRSASGYIAKPRAVVQGASMYDRIMIMPASRAPAVTNAPAPFAARPQPQVVMPNVVIDDDGEPTGTPMPPGAMVPGQFPNQPASPQQFQQQPGFQTQPGQQPTLSRPGMLPPPVGTPGNPYQPNQPPQMPIRPPGVPGPGGGGDGL